MTRLGRKKKLESKQIQDNNKIQERHNSSLLIFLFSRHIFFVN